MERYFHNEPDDNEDEQEHEDMEHFVRASKADVLDVMHLEIAEQEINERLLQQAYKRASSEWKWTFRSTTFKMKKVQRIFDKLKRIISED